MNGEVSDGEEAASDEGIENIDKDLDAVIESLRPLKPMQAFLSIENADKPQKHRQRPPKEDSAAEQEATEK